MSEATPSNATTVIVEYLAHEQLSIAHFSWADTDPLETYEIHINDHTTFVFDSHFPVRPAILRHYREVTRPQRSELVRYVGSQLTAALDSVRLDSPLILHTTFSRENRLAMARLQYESLESPDQLRQGCRVMLEEQGVHLDEPPAM